MSIKYITPAQHKSNLRVTGANQGTFYQNAPVSDSPLPF